MGYVSRFTSLFTFRYLGRLLLLSAAICGAYLIAQWIGFSFYAAAGYTDFIWPPTAAIALAALFFWGYELWPGVALGAYIVNMLIGAPPPVAFGLAVGSTLEALAGAYVLRRVVRLDPMFERVRDAVGLIVTGITVTITGATFGAASLVLGGIVPLSNVPEVWMAWWVGDSLSLLVLGPFLLRWIKKPLFTRTYPQLIEGIAISGLLLLAESLAYFSPFPQLERIPLSYIFIPLLWVSLRTGMRGLTTANLVTALFTLVSVLSKHGPFTQGSIADNLFIGQIFVATVSIIFFVFTASVEERREAERELEAHVDTLEHTVEKISSEDQAKSDFLAVLAHELRNPLAPIVSSLELIKINGMLPQNAKLFDIIEVQARTMERLLDDLLETTRILHKKFKLQKDVIELQSVLNNSIEAVRPLMKERKHKFAVSMPKEALWLHGDPVRISQIFVNIFTNAAKYTERGGRISVRCWAEKSEAHVEIADTGIGIEPYMLKKIFEPFVQANESAPESGIGLGLGLALTKQLVELHGGSISVTSGGKGTGSVFTVVLPALHTAPLPIFAPVLRKTAEKKSATSQIERTIYEILIVDDNEVAAHVLQKLLEHDGHFVRGVHTGADAIEYVRKNHPEVVILDIGLPDMSGYDVAKHLREEHGDALFLIALSGYGQKEDKEKAAKAGFDYHLTKPASVKEIEEVLQRGRAAV